LAILSLLVSADIGYGTVAWQWLFRVYSLPQVWVLSKRWLAMDVCSASDIPAFKQHATISSRILWLFIYQGAFTMNRRVLNLKALEDFDV
jgi:hypothetical protein